MRQALMFYQQLPSVVRGLPRAPQGFNPNQVGGTLTLFLPLTVTLFIYLIRYRHADGLWVLRMVGTSFTLVLMTITLILTQSRWSYVSTFLALLFLGLSQRGLLRWFTVVVCLLGVGVVGFLGPVTVAYGVLGDSTLENWTAQGFLPGRVEIWQRAAVAIRDHPLTGIGFDTLVPIVHARYPTYLLAPGSDFTHAHNLYLQTALDLGIPGLIGFLALLIVWVRMLWQVRQQAEQAFDRALATGLLFGVTGQLLFGLADAIALGQKPGVFFWVYLGVGGALWMHHVEKPGETGSVC
jgi:putative inorganic carbon (HCO3(-)) transporter